MNNYSSEDENENNNVIRKQNYNYLTVNQTYSQDYNTYENYPIININ